AQTSGRVLHAQLAHLKMADAHAASGAQALDLLRQAAASEARPFDLVIIDLDLPDMDGLSLAQAIKAESSLASTRLIMLTSLGQRLTTATMQEAGISACLVKPLRQSRLFDSLVDVMGL